MTERTYKREDFTAVSSSVRDLLKSLETYAGRSLRQRDFQRLADEIAATDPFSIISSMMKPALKAQVTRSEGWSEIHEICLFR